MKKILLLIGISCTLVCCGKGLNKVDEATARSRAKLILVHQKSSDFHLPNSFSIKLHNVKEREDKTYDGTDIEKEDVLQEFNWDLDKLACRIYDKKIYSQSTSTEIENICYFDEKEDRLCFADNENGYKHYSYDKSKTRKGKDKSKQYLIDNFLDTNWGKAIKDVGFLNNFDAYVDSLNKLIIELKDKKDQYCNVSYGSNDEHSLQLTNEYKTELIFKKGAVDQKFDYKGYEIYKNNALYEDDLLTVRSFDQVNNTKTDNGIFSTHLHLSSEITSNKKESKFSYPNLNDYVKDE